MIFSTFAAIAIIAAAAPTEAQLSSRQGDVDIIPAFFQGVWGESTTACADDEGTGKITVSATRIEGYELDAQLLKISGIGRSTAPGGAGSHHATLLLAESGEGRVGIGAMVISRAGDRLFASRKVLDKKLTVAEQYASPYVPCPVAAK